MKKDDSVYLRHVLDAISRIEEYTQDITYQDFLDNHLRQDGVIRQIEIIGEATKKLSLELKERYPEIPWKDVAGMVMNGDRYHLRTELRGCCFEVLKAAGVAVPPTLRC